MAKTCVQEDDVDKFLKEFKSVWDGFVAKRPKNDETLSILCITFQHRVEEIRSLKPRGYVKGPEKEKDPNKPTGDIWVFAKKVCGEQIYIKLKIYKTPKGVKRGSCISFHIADGELKCPYEKA
jgi:hypothetical protein